MSAAEKSYTDVLTDTHRVCLEWIAAGARVLECGCGGGVLTRALRDKGCKVTGVELSAGAASRAAPYCEEIVVGNIDEEATWKRAQKPFDAVVLADVLEHLQYPDVALRRAREMLDPKGTLVVAVPNVAHFSVRWSLLRGRFDYTEFGILDDTHLRFFTKKTLRECVERSGFGVEEIRANVIPFRGDGLFERLGLGRLKRAVNRVLTASFPEATAYKWCVRCVPVGPSGGEATEGVVEP